MSWQFTEWKRFAGGGAVAGVVLIITGMLLTTDPWTREEAQTHYLTTRDYLEIIGGFAERETAFATTTNFVPLQDDWWHGSFNVTNAATGIRPDGTIADGVEYKAASKTTNAVSMYYRMPFPPRADFFPFESIGNTLDGRMWVQSSLSWLIGLVGTNDYDLFDMDHSYWMGSDWWATNIHSNDWPDTYQASDSNEYYKVYVDTESITAVRAAMSNCQYQLSAGRPSSGSGSQSVYGYGTSYTVFEGTPYAGFDGPAYYDGALTVDKDWSDVFDDAYTNLLDAIDSTDLDDDGFWSTRACFGVRLHAEWEYDTISDSYNDGSGMTNFRYEVKAVVLSLHVGYRDCYERVCGTNVTVYALARPRLADTNAWYDFYHPDFGSTEPTALQSAQCALANVTGNVWQANNELLAYQPAPVAGTNNAAYTKLREIISMYGDTYPPARPGSSDPESHLSGLGNAEWMQPDNTCGFFLDWEFDYMTGDE